MTAQAELFAITNGAIDQAEEHADPQWMRDAYRCVQVLAGKGEPFSTDDCWALLEKVSTARTHEPRAMGPVMRAAKTAGLIRNTKQYVNSQRPECHQRPIPLWVGVSDTPLNHARAVDC